MDYLDEYRRIIRERMQQFAQVKSARGDIETEVIIDPSNDHYEVMCSGWNGNYRIHGSALHIDIRNGKVWIQYDGTPDGIANELVEAGIPREHIVLAFKAPEVRQYTDFAVS